MKTWTIIAALAACVCLAQEKPKNLTGWVPMFDGKSLSGWHPENQATWAVNRGIIVGSEGDGWLRSEKIYADFALRLDFRNSAKGNSGVFLRASKDSKVGEPQNPASGYELQIYNEDPNWATGSIEDVIQRLAPVNPAPGAWHRYEVEVRGDHLTATLDGVKVLDGHDSHLKSGYIGLQHHKDNKVEFRKVMIKSVSES
jgi:hypothetical protein